MAESSLSLAALDFANAVGYYIGWGRDTSIGTPTVWSAAQLAEVLRIVNSGYRQFLYPPPIADQKVPYEWSFLKKTGSLTIANTNTDLDLA